MNKPTPCAEHRSRSQPDCLECRRYRREKWHWYRQGTANPSTRRVPSQPVRDHIRSLHKSGMRLVDIAADAGMSTCGQLTRILYGDRLAVTAGVAARLFAVHPRPVESPIVDAVGVRRRARALARAGWNLTDLAMRIGYTAPVGPKWAYAVRVHLGTLEKVAALYDELSSLDGGSIRAARWAERRGWHPPEAWSDSTIDDPAAEPYSWCRGDIDEVAIEQFEAGALRWSGLSDAEQREMVRRHLGAARPVTLAKRWGTTRGRVEKLAAEVAAEVTRIREVA